MCFRYVWVRVMLFSLSVVMCDCRLVMLVLVYGKGVVGVEGVVVLCVCVGRGVGVYFIRV